MTERIGGIWGTILSLPLPHLSMMEVPLLADVVKNMESPHLSSQSRVIVIGSWGEKAVSLSHPLQLYTGEV